MTAHAYRLSDVSRFCDPKARARRSFLALTALVPLLAAACLDQQDEAPAPDATPVSLSASARPGSPLPNRIALSEAQRAIESCAGGEVRLTYGFGSETVRLSRQPPRCVVQIDGEVEGTRFVHHCEVPLARMKDWWSWRDTEEPGQLASIEAFCRRSLPAP